MMEEREDDDGSVKERQESNVNETTMKQRGMNVQFCYHNVC